MTTDPLDPDPLDDIEPDPFPWEGAPYSTFVDDDTAQAQVQLDIFAAAGSVADLPLFSGTAPRQTIKPFIPAPVAPKQGKMEL